MSHLLDLDEQPESELQRELERRAKLRSAGLCDYCERPVVGSAPCKLSDRHQLFAGHAPPPTPLTECPRHPQSVVWQHPQGPRCSICGVSLDGAPIPSESPVVRTLDGYQQLAKRTGSKEPQGERAICITAMGLAGEAGELVDLIKKAVRNRKPGDPIELPRERIRDEAGDLLWYVANIACSAGLTLSEIAQANVDKLVKRYPEGFTVEAALQAEKDKAA